MAIEVEFFGLTGIVGGQPNDLILLRHAPSTGFSGEYDVAVDPIDGPAQISLKVDNSNINTADFGVTHLDASGNTGALMLNLPNSDIKDVLNDVSHGVTGLLTLRAVYNYET